MRKTNFHQSRKQPSLAGVPQGVAQAQATQAQIQAMQQQMFLNMYFPLVVQLGQYRVNHGYDVEGGLSEPSTPERVAEEAWAYADAAMKRLLVPVKEDDKEDDKEESTTLV